MAEIQLRFPGPSSIVRTAFRVVEWELEVVRLVGSLPARVVVLLDQADEIVARIGGIVDDAVRAVAAIDGVILAAAQTIDSVNATVRSADRVVGRVDATVDAADALIGRAVPMLEFAESAVSEVRPVVQELLLEEGLRVEEARALATKVTDALVYADRLGAKLAPIVDQVVDSIDPDEVKAVVSLIDHLPLIVSTLETDVLPVLASLDNVGPEVHQILDVAQQCLEALAGIPGFQFLRRRGESGNGNGNGNG